MESDTKNSIISLKQKLIDILLFYGAILGLISFLVSVYPFGPKLLTPEYLTDLVSIFLLFLIFFFRKALPLKGKAIFIIVAICTIILSDLVTSGMYSSNLLLLTLVPFISVLAFEKWTVIGISSFLVLSYSIIASLHLTGALDPSTYPNENTSILKWIDVGIITICISFIYSVFVFRYDGSVKKFIADLELGNKKLLERDAQLQDNLEEKEVLLQEIHHRVKNNLAVVSGLLELQSTSIQDPNAKLMLSKSINRIISIAKVHEMLYESNNFSKIPFAKYIDELASTVISNMNKDGTEINFESKIEVGHVNINLGVPLGIIFNELITNSVKYAFPNQAKNQISIHMSQIEDTYHVVYKDNGIGIQNFEDATSKSLGFTIIHSLMHQIEANYEYDTTNCFEVSFSFISDY